MIILDCGLVGSCWSGIFLRYTSRSNCQPCSRWVGNIGGKGKKAMEDMVDRGDNDT